MHSLIHSRHAGSPGFTLIELLVVISIIAILAGMLMPVLGIVQDNARRARCASNQKQLVLAMVAYANDYDGAWPARPTAAANGPQVAANAGTDPFTGPASLELLAVAMGGDLMPAIFTCAGNPTVKPAAAAAASIAGGNATWAPGSGSSQPAYAYDWTVPANASSMRVVLADRPVSALQGAGHRGGTTPVTFADGHSGTIPKGLGVPAGAKTKDLTGADYAGWFANRDANNDNIYSDDGDGGGNSPGNGSTTRAWVR
ncbi:MAG: type II secretion system GspH family protein [Planctomycetes bacterium]|nr:type II secretion system GspH family protein [Planctomycetota bacterium]